MVAENLLAVLSRTTKLKKFKLFQEDIPQDLLEHYQNSGVIAIDTELTGLNLFRDKVATIQISDGVSTHSIIQMSKQGWVAENIKKLLESNVVRKVFHHALLDVSMIQQDLGISVKNFRCTKIASKTVRTYTEKHGLKDLSEELLGVKMEKKTRESCWFSQELSQDQLQYAIGDVVRLLDIYNKLNELIEARGQIGSGMSCQHVNEEAQIAMQHMIPLLVSGYGSPDQWDLGWLFRY